MILIKKKKKSLIEPVTYSSAIIIAKNQIYSTFNGKSFYFFIIKRVIKIKIIKKKSGSRKKDKLKLRNF